MKNYEEKMKAVEILKAAVESVNNALDAIDCFARANGLQDCHVTIPGLAGMVSAELEMKPECVCAVLEAAFAMIKDLNLTVDVEDSEDDE